LSDSDSDADRFEDGCTTDDGSSSAAATGTSIATAKGDSGASESASTPTVPVVPASATVMSNLVASDGKEGAGNAMTDSGTPLAVTVSDASALPSGTNRGRNMCLRRLRC
jgi:hypothetical protein